MCILLAEKNMVMPRLDRTGEVCGYVHRDGTACQNEGIAEHSGRCHSHKNKQAASQPMQRTGEQCVFIRKDGERCKKDGIVNNAGRCLWHKDCAERRVCTKCNKNTTTSRANICRACANNDAYAYRKQLYGFRDRGKKGDAVADQAQPAQEKTN